MYNGLGLRINILLATLFALNVMNWSSHTNDLHGYLNSS